MASLCRTAYLRTSRLGPRLLACLMVIGLAAAMASTSAWAQWNEVAKAKSGDIWMMDAATARKTGDTARVWVLINYPQSVTHPPPYSYSGVRSIRALVQVDCKQQRARRLEASFFTQPGAEGRLLGDSANDDWFNVPPDTPDSDLMKVACELPDQAAANPPAAPATAPAAAPAAAPARAPAAPRRPGGG